VHPLGLIAASAFVDAHAEQCNFHTISSIPFANNHLTSRVGNNKMITNNHKELLLNDEYELFISVVSLWEKSDCVYMIVHCHTDKGA
jgi:hypothetical protein